LDSSSQQSLIQEKSGKYTRQEHALLQQPRTKIGQAKRQYELCIVELNQELGECEYCSEQHIMSKIGRIALNNKCTIAY
jgi:hypothetical protein